MEEILKSELEQVRQRVAEAVQEQEPLIRSLKLESAFVQMLSVLKVGVQDAEIVAVLKEIQDAYYRQ